MGFARETGQCEKRISVQLLSVAGLSSLWRFFYFGHRNIDRPARTLKMSSFHGASLDTSFGQGGGYAFRAPSVQRKLFAPIPVKHQVNLNYFWNGGGTREKDILPKNLNSAEFQLKLSRLRSPLILVTIIQIWFILLSSLLFPRSCCVFDTKFTFGLNYLCDVGGTLLSSVFSLVFLLLTIALMLIVSLFAAFISGPRKVDKHFRIYREFWKPRTFINSPIVLAAVIFGYFYGFVLFFHPEYTGSYIIPSSSAADGYFLREQLFVILLVVFFSSVEFFTDNLENGEFTMDMPTNHVKWTLVSLMLSEVRKNLKKSFVLGSAVWAFYLFVCRPFYVFTFGSVYKDETFFGNVIQLLSNLVFNFGFLKRVFLYSFMTRISLRLYLKIVNRQVSQKCNLPLSAQPAMGEHLLLFDAMKGENSYMKHLAFAQYYSKADVVDVDTMLFFQLSHPGNHAVHWKTAFAVCCEFLSATNSKIVATFSSTAKLPLHMERLRLKSSSQSSSSDPSEPTVAPADNPVETMRSMMRDLSAMPSVNPPQSNPSLRDMLEAEFWKAIEDFKMIPKSFANWLTAYLIRLLQSTPDIMPFPLAIAKVPEELHINNLLYDHMLVYWAMMGTMKLFCCSVHGKSIDPRNMVFQDVNTFLKIMMELYGSFIYMETYLDNMIDLYPTLNKELLEHHKKIASRLSNTSVLVIMEMNNKFSPFYDIIGVPLSRFKRICEILGSKGL